MSRRGSKSLYDYCIENNIEPMLDEWDTKRNGNLTPRNVAYGSQKKAWWCCPNGHSWEEAVRTRASKYKANGSGCRICLNRVVVPGINDLATTHPDVATQWHPTKNGDLKSTDVVGGINKEVWWLCSKGHEWQASPYSRTRLGTGCPYCNHGRVWPGEELSSTHPGIAAMWHPTKNGELKPIDVTCTAFRRVWWQCDKGHEWMMAVNKFVRDGSCPICANKVVTGVNDLVTTHPEIAAFWHQTKNPRKKPTRVTSNSEDRVWWQCDKGHEWIMSVEEMVKNGPKCPYCADKKTEEERYMRLVDLILAGK